MESKVVNLLQDKETDKLSELIKSNALYVSASCWISLTEYFSTDLSVLKNIFMAATRSFNNPLIWSKYCEFLLAEFCKGTEPLDFVEERLEKALSCCGSDYSVGFTIRKIYMEFLNQIGRTSEIRAIHERAFYIPQSGIHEIWNDFCVKFGRDPTVEKTYLHSLELSKKRELIEEKLTGMDPFLYYQAVFDEISAFYEPVWLKCYAENFVSLFPFEEKSWLFILFFLHEKFPEKQLVLLTAQNSLKFIPSSLSLWKLLFEFLVHYQTDYASINEFLSKAAESLFSDCSSFVGFHLFYLKLLIKIKKDFSEIRAFYRDAISKIEKYFHFSYCLSLDIVWIDFLRSGEFSCNASEEWEKIIRRHPSDTVAWSWFISDEQKYCKFSAPNRITSLFKRAIGTLPKDKLEYFFTEWETFEEQYGSVESSLTAKEKRHEFLQKSQISYVDNGDSKGKKQKLSHDHDSKSETIENSSTSLRPSSVDKLENTTIPTYKSSHTVFISNLSYNATQKDVEEFFSSKNVIPIDVRMPQDKNGRPSKGFAYVEFENEQVTAKALSFDREKLKGRPLYISRYHEKGNKPSYSVHEDKRTLFVSGIPVDYTRDLLAPIFPTSNQIRLLQTRTGASKRIAYVEYQSEEICMEFFNSLHGNEKVKQLSVNDDVQLKVEVSNPQKAHDEKVMKKVASFLPPKLFNSDSFKTSGNPSNAKTAADITKPSLTNEDFKRFLMK